MECLLDRPDRAPPVCAAVQNVRSVAVVAPRYRLGASAITYDTVTALAEQIHIMQTLQNHSPFILQCCGLLLLSIPEMMRLRRGQTMHSINKGVRVGIPTQATEDEAKGAEEAPPRGVGRRQRAGARSHGGVE